MLVFTQSFPKGLPSTAVGNSNDVLFLPLFLLLFSSPLSFSSSLHHLLTHTQVISAFPGFQDVAENFYFTFSGTFANPVLGKYDPAKKPSFDIQVFISSLSLLCLPCLFLAFSVQSSLFLAILSSVSFLIHML